MQSPDRVLPAIQRVEDAFRSNPDTKWLLGFSGGKDSSALLRIVAHAARRLAPDCPEVTIFYCDTGVESLVLDAYVKNLMTRLQDECRASNFLNFNLEVLRAPINERFFVKIIGRGYPPPTTFFRWCTKSLRIRPVQRFLNSEDKAKKKILMLGTRADESSQRSRVIQAFEDPFWQKPIETNGCDLIFAPIVDFNLSDVWDCLHALNLPESLDASDVVRLYEDAQGECPIIRELNDKPCAAGRLGCWTCTVVRKDKSAENFVRAGHENLRPFLEFRNWLAEFRNDLEMRWPCRRNGRPGPGPFSLHARTVILQRLQALEQKSGITILEEEELVEIERLWAEDLSVEPKVMTSD